MGHVVSHRGPAPGARLPRPRRRGAARQERKGQPFTHGGSFHAPDQAFADAYAREFYARRQESVALWVVPREAIVEIEFGSWSGRSFDERMHHAGPYDYRCSLHENERGVISGTEMPHSGQATSSSGCATDSTNVVRRPSSSDSRRSGPCACNKPSVALRNAK